jgi:hypothetical protein
MLRSAIVAFLTIFLILSPVSAADPPEGQKSPEELVTEGMRTLMEAMKLFMHSLPQFGEPYINENGDIVIPRVHPDAPEDKSKPEEKDKGKRQI